MRLPVKVLFAVSAAVSGYKERKSIIRAFFLFFNVNIKCFNINVLKKSIPSLSDITDIF